MSGRKRGRQFCVLCVGVQLLALFGLGLKYYLPKGESFLVTLDWHQFHQQDAACDWLGQFGASVAYPGVPTTQALLLKGAASHWPATSLISVDWLVHNTSQTKPLGTCIVSPTSTFKIFNNNSALIEASADPERAPGLPARLELMTIQEFVKRQKHTKDPMYWPEGEFYYYQGPLPKELKAAIRPTTRPLSCLNQSLAVISAQKAARGEAEESQMLALTGALMRLTDADTTHIAHYDSSATAMLQLKGIKDVRLIPPSQLNATYPWERGTLLYRRARVNLTNPDYKQFPLAKQLTPVKIRLHPGDFLIFPAYVPHQPEAVTDSISISFRMKTVTPKSKGDPRVHLENYAVHQEELRASKASISQQ